MNNAIRAKIFDLLASHITNPATELQYSSNFELLVAVMLSAQSTDVSVNKATSSLFKVANSPRHMIELGEEKLKTYIKTIGLYNSKAKNIIATAGILQEQYNGRVPDTRKELESLPGVGRKTANVMLNTAFGHDTIAVDTHIFRVCNRTKIAPGKTVLEVEKKLNRTTPTKHKKDAHHLLILHGRYTCMARKPKCNECIIAGLCASPSALT